MVLKRKLYQYLLNWKNSSSRKPLIIRGARQVGKSTLVNQFSSEYKQYISLNLELPEHKNFFEEINNIDDIVNALFLSFNISKNKNEILVFIDEIQESPKAIAMLRYFYEKHPYLHVIAAGSLLEFALKKVKSFPVGRIQQVVLHPFDFEEYLMALNHDNALKEITTIPIKKYTHDTLMKLFHQYALIGGMPEVMKVYIDDKTLAGINTIYENLWLNYMDDVEKYASNATERKVIRHIIESAPAEKDRIAFAGFGNSNYKSREVGEGLRSLDQARVIQMIYPSTSLTPPITSDLKRNPRLQFLDTGLLNHSLGLQAEMIGVKDLNDFHRGKIILHLVTQQLQAQKESPLFRPSFWVREKANSSAEVDLLFQSGKYIIPIEVKSGEQGKLRSLHQFMESTNHSYAVRLLANHFSVEHVKTPAGKKYLLMNLPYYLSTRLPQYIEWFILNH